MLKKIPNILTIGRILIVPFFVLAFYLPGFYGDLTALILFVVASFTDFLDGMLARLLGEESKLGELLDPIADKVLLACVLLALASHYTRDWLFIAPALIIFLREFIISGFREYMSKEGIIINVSMLAKWKTTLQLVAVGLIILSMVFAENAFLAYTSIATLWLSAIVTLQTAYDYLKLGLSELKH